MPQSLESFAEMSLKVVAVRTADNGDFGFEFPGSGHILTPAAETIPLEQTADPTAIRLRNILDGSTEG